MQNTLFDSLIAAHCERQLTFRVCKTPGALQKRPSEGVGFSEFPKRRPFFGGSPVSFISHHMKLPKQIMRQNSRQHIKVIAVQPSYGDIIQIALRFQFAERIFLRPSAVMEIHDLLHGCLFVRNDHLELIAVFMRNEQIELDRLFGLLLAHPTNKEKAKESVPALGLAGCVEIRNITDE